MPAANVASSPATTGKETAKSVAVLEDLIKNLNISSSADEALAAAGNLATLFSGPIPEQTLPLKAAETFKKQLANKKDATARERALRWHPGHRLPQHSRSPVSSPTSLPSLPRPRRCR